MNPQKIAEAIYVVNCHAKTATQPQQLYTLKRVALNKLIREGSAQVIGLHRYSSKPRSRPPHCVLIRCNNYYFHKIPSRHELHHLKPIIGTPDHRNPKVRLSLSKAKIIISNYIGKDHAERTLCIAKMRSTKNFRTW
ncbi:YkyB family protein [Sporolactobacillus terrae]|uniref:YkyB family protein n=1 Tax=Sporolactobacillus terrae TaxID=269673 RepID=UPI0009DE8A1F|nr:YkyB family protein [Sporolactobacillus terrae]UAK17539.1 hypothetical protein K7399_06330 [Sporolactobacillus terrae]